jgi:hypothetical protein
MSLLASLFAIMTMGLLMLGCYKIFSVGVFEITELTFLMFACFVLSVLLKQVAEGPKDGNSN